MVKIFHYLAGLLASIMVMVSAASAAEVEASLRKVAALIDEINRKWPFERDTKMKLP